MIHELPDFMVSVLSLVKRNNGLFKSAKQGKFLTRIFEANGTLDAKYVDLKIDPKFKTFSFDDYVRWCDYGNRSVRPYGWFFIYDQYGIVRQYKLAWKEIGPNHLTTLNPEKIKVVFERPSDVDLSKLKAEYEEMEQKDAETPCGDWVGNIKDRIKKVVNVVGVSEFFNDFGLVRLIRMVDADNNALVWFATNGVKIERGEKVLVVGTVKKHDKYRGNKQTILTRCKMFRAEPKADESTEDDGNETEGA